METATTQQPKQFDGVMFQAALGFYGHPSHYKRTFAQSDKVNPNTGKPYLNNVPVADAARAGKASWVQVNPSARDMAKNASGFVKPTNKDIETVQNITMDFEYPADPGRVHQIGLALADKLVEMGLAESGLPVEDSGAGCHIVIPIAPLNVASAGSGELVNEAITWIVEHYIKQEFEKLAKEHGLAGKVKLEAFDISRILSVPGTWRPGGSKPNEAEHLALGYLRRWLPPFDGNNYPTRNESQTLTDLIKATCTMLIADKEEAKARAAQPKTSQGNKGFDFEQWLRNYASRHTLSGDKSSDFFSLCQAGYLKTGDVEEVVTHAVLINELVGTKENYVGREEREARRCLKSLPQRTSREEWFTSKGYEYKPDYETSEQPNSTQPRQGQEPPRQPPPTGKPVNNEEPLTLHNLTDLGNARRLVERFGQDLKFVKEWDWIHWDGRRWKQDKTGAAKRIAKSTVRTIYTEAGQIDDSTLRKNTADHARKSEASGRLEAMLNLAETEIEVVATPDQFDRDHWLLTCLNGTFDLRTGELRAHRREDLITKLVPVEYQPEAQCPEFLNFLDAIFDKNQNLIRFLQKAIGYSLTGLTNEQVLFLFYGTGRNGKSTLLSILGELLGDYAQPSDFKTFLERNSDGPRNDIAKLAGARLVTAAEADPGKRLAESVVKQLTGGDIITARFLNREFFEFRPTFKLFLAANHKPQIRGQDLGIWRRIMLLPFLVTIPESKVDKHLEGKLKKELQGIFAWAVQGCHAWQKEGLTPPAEVREATDAYKDESDILRDFLAECCIAGRNKKVELGECYKAYTKWCEDEQEHPLGKRNFIDAMTQRGYFMEAGHARKRFFHGVELAQVNAGKDRNRYENPETFEDF